METRRQVKEYAARHGLTMAEAIEAIVYAGRYYDKDMLDALVEVCVYVLEKDWDGASRVAERVKNHAYQPTLSSVLQKRLHPTEDAKE